MPSSRQASSTAISGLRVQSEYSVWTAVTGCTAWALRMVPALTSDRPMVDLALFHQPAQFADAVLDRDLLVPAMQVVQVDHVGLQAAQAVLAVPADRLR